MVTNAKLTKEETRKIYVNNVLNAKSALSIAKISGSGIVASQVEDLPQSWLWKNWLPEDLPVLYTAPAGVGKSTFSAYVAAVVSTGGKWATGERCEKKPVVIVNIEDKNGDMKRKLISHGADLDSVHFLDVVKIEDKSLRTSGELPFQLPRDFQVLEKKLLEIGGAGLVILDPCSAVMKNSSNNDFVRDKIMTPLKNFCESNNVCVMIVNHPNRGRINETNEASIIGGAKAFHDSSRVSLFAVPDEMEEGKATIKQVKNNLAKKQTPLEYRIRETRDERVYLDFGGDKKVIALTNQTEIDIVALLHAEERAMNTSEIVQFMKLSGHNAGTVKVYLGRMVASHKLKRDGNGWYKLTTSLRGVLDADDAESDDAPTSSPIAPTEPPTSSHTPLPIATTSPHTQATSAASKVPQSKGAAKIHKVTHNGIIDDTSVIVTLP